MSTKLKPQRRVSHSLPLVLATSAAVVGLTSCNRNESNGSLTSVRDEYNSLEDCQQDWGSSDPCQPQPASANSNTIAHTGNTSGDHVYTGRYWGPQYSEGQRDIAQRNFLGSRYLGGTSQLTDRAVSRSVTRSISRGGFGSSSRGFSGGG
ncbi:hypothetical protein [Undibacterium fentianense]|uniref:Lipoprotein n=1 Tax=Undibacterium fentianense TaxID=2828728 RepID=A0A941IE04_9BURK|nr:hypothetical protein [Undibacterium fentianense]MBR7799126.1 hypothetical protein [Undibacterium fentianense]